MHVPYLHTTRIGIYFAAEYLTWVELRRERDDTSIFAIDQENYDAGGSACALQRVVKRQQPSFPYVYTHVDPVYVRHLEFKEPSIELREDRDRWFREEITPRIIGASDPTDFIFRKRILHSTGDETHCLAVCVRKDVIETQYKLLASAGLHVVGIGPLLPGIGSAFMQKEAFVSGRNGVLYQTENNAYLECYSNGQLSRVMKLESSSDSDVIRNADRELQIYESERSGDHVQEVYFVSSVDDYNSKQVADVGRSIDLGHSFQPVRPGFFASESKMGSQHIPAHALAVQAVFAGLQSFNLLSNETQLEGRQKAEKQNAMLVGAYAASILVTLMLLVLASNFWLSSELAQTQNALMQHEPQWTAYRAAQNEYEALQEDISNARRLISGRSRAARTLYEVGQAVPANIRLRRLRVTGGDDKATVEMSGRAEGARSIANLLRRLDGSNRLDNSRLLFTRQVTDRKETSPRAIDLSTQFKISLDVVN